jgi:hypothetical protein
VFSVNPDQQQSLKPYLCASFHVNLEDEYKHTARKENRRRHKEIRQLRKEGETSGDYIENTYAVEEFEVNGTPLRSLSVQILWNLSGPDRAWNVIDAWGFNAFSGCLG